MTLSIKSSENEGVLVHKYSYLLYNKQCIFISVSIFVMQSEKTCHMVQNWYFELLVSCESLNYSLSRTFYLDLLWFWYQKLLMFKGNKNKEKHRNCDVNFLYFAVSYFVTCDGFSQITSHFVTSQSCMIRKCWLSVFSFCFTALYNGVQLGKVYSSTDCCCKARFDTIYCPDELARKGVVVSSKMIIF